ncbi:MAG: hypothetical protein MUP33_07715 [Polaromonas sp.]|nr:hypothetical protein [Polaromonas sp.]
MATHQAVAQTERAAMAWLLYLPNRVLPAKLPVWIDHLAAVLGGRRPDI